MSVKVIKEIETKPLANLTGACLCCANFRDANLINADLRNAIGIQEMSTET